MNDLHPIYWIMVVVGFILLGIISTPSAKNTYFRFPDQELHSKGNWGIIKLPRYQGGRPLSSKKTGDELAAISEKNIEVSEVLLRLYSYGESENRITITLESQNKIIRYGNDLKGVHTYSVTFDPPVLTNKISFATAHSVSANSISIEHGVSSRQLTLHSC